MTNHWNDIENSDVIMVIGSNAAENHPMSFKYVTRAQRRVDRGIFDFDLNPSQLTGAQLIVVDPRFTRTASLADVTPSYAPSPHTGNVKLYSQLRSGTDIAFMNGMMKYAIDNGKVNWNYLRDCTNASYMVDAGFETCREGSPGEFSGLQVETTKRHRANNYDKTTWGYQYVVAGQPNTNSSAWGACNSGDISGGLAGAPHAQSVWAKLINHLAPYTISKVCDITGADPTTLQEIYEVYTDTYADEKSACIMYAMGTTQHTYGTQNIRTYAMMQLLMGNTGVAGGGINALRGESNVQGSTDMCLLWHILPGYLAVTTNKVSQKDRTAYNANYTTGKAPLDVTPGDPVSLSWWRFGNKYMDSLLQAWWPLELGLAAGLDTAYHFLPKADKDRAYSHIDIFEDMGYVAPGPGIDEKFQEILGLMCWGQNPAVAGPSSSFERGNLANLDWLVSVDLWETETAAFWKPTVPGDGSSDCLGIPGVSTSSIGTTVYQLPAAASYEKEGSVVNSSRWSQWRYKAAEPPVQAMDDLSIISELAQRLIALYAADGSIDWRVRYPVSLLWWGPYCDPAGMGSNGGVPGGTPHEDAHGMDGSNYDDGATDPRTGLLHANPHKVAKEINGYFCPSAGGGAQVGTRVNNFWGANAATQTLRTNGETSSGNWLYCSHYVNPTDSNTPPASAPNGQNGNRQELRNPVDVVRTGYPGTQIGLFSNWSYCWPLNRRIIYNGASVYQPGHPNVGQPLAPQKWVVAWDAAGTSFRGPGGDVSDGYKPPGAAGCRMPFIMHREGHAHLFGYGREDGPFAEHYEPWDTVCTQNPLGATNTAHLNSPTLFRHPRAQALERATPGDPAFPIVASTYRLTEHWQSGPMTRNNPWPCQLQPEAFAELSEELASALGISNGDTVEIKTQRTELYGKRMEAKACVTKRFKPYSLVGGGVSGDEVHHIGVIWHYGYSGLCTGHSANLLTPHCGDANTGIPESKAFTCNIRKLGGTFLP